MTKDERRLLTALSALDRGWAVTAYKLSRMTGQESCLAALMGMESLNGWVHGTRPHPGAHLLWKITRAGRKALAAEEARRQ